MCIVDEEAYRAFSDIFDKYPTALEDYVNTLLYDNDNCYEQIDEFILYTHRDIDRLFALYCYCIVMCFFCEN